MDATVQYLTRQKPWLSWNAETNPGLNHDFNPIHKEDFENRTEEWWETLTSDSKYGKALINSFALFMGEDYEERVFKHHGRLKPTYDGEIGLAVTDLLTSDRCGCPDYMTEPASGSGSWAPGCLGNEGTYEVYFHVDERNMPYRDWWPQIKKMAQDAYAEMLMGLRETTNKSEAHIHNQFQVLAGSTIGLAQLPGSGHCQRGFFCKLDPGYRPNINQVAQLLAHEWGHNMNSGHISGDPIMHPSMRNQNWNGSFKNTPFGRRLENYYRGGNPIDGDNPGDPTDQIFGEIQIGENFTKITRTNEWKSGTYQILGIQS